MFRTSAAHRAAVGGLNRRALTMLCWTFAMGSVILSAAEKGLAADPDGGTFSISDAPASVRPVSTHAACHPRRPCGRCPRCVPPSYSDDAMGRPEFPSAPQVPTPPEDTDETLELPAPGDSFADDLLAAADTAPRVRADSTRPSLGADTFPNIRGNFCQGAGQLVIQPPPVIISQPVFDFFSNLRSDIGNDQFRSLDGTIVFDVPDGILPGGPPDVINQWPISLPGETDPSGTAYLIGVDANDGRYVVNAEILQGFQDVEVPQPPILVNLPSLGCSRRVKIAENNNPFPACRVFFTYDYFHNASLTSGIPGRRRDLGVDRYVFGIERTILGGLGSVEARLPLVRDLDPEQVLTGDDSVQSSEVGNLSLTFKFVLSASESSVLTTGLGMNFPTGPDGQVRAFDPYRNDVRRILQYDNESVHLAPFVAYGVASRNRRFFAQAWGQLDIDPNGSSVRANYNGVQGDGRIQDQTLLFLDGMVGYNLMDRRCPAGPLRLRRITPALELHYTGTLQDADIIQSGNLLLGNLANQQDILDFTVACHFSIGQRLKVTPAYVTPLTQGDNRYFDGEFGVQLNYYRLRFSTTPPEPPGRRPSTGSFRREVSAPFFFARQSKLWRKKHEFHDASRHSLPQDKVAAGGGRGDPRRAVPALAIG